MPAPTPKKRLLIFIVAYNAESTIQNVLGRIPASIAEYDTEILIIDDSSKDATFDRARDFGGGDKPLFPVTVLYNPVNQGYGGNQKIGFHYAIEKGFDIVALVHGDGQYAPECLPELIVPLIEEQADAVFGSRMMVRSAALKGGMPLYKYVGNKMLTAIQNRLLRASLSEFHSGYRLYSVEALRRIPFGRNTNDFHFDTEIIIQLLRAGLRIQELPIPTYYGDEICHVNGIKYGLDVVRASLLSRVQDFGILYERKFDVKAEQGANPLYQSKLAFESPHTRAVKIIPSGSTVADIGCASGYVSRALREQGCRVTGVDYFLPADVSGLERFVEADLDRTGFPLDAGAFEYVLLLDVIEHLKSPEQFLESLRRSRRGEADTKVIISTGNVGFIITRMGLLFGQFNYGLRGILDLTHTRLFTFGSARKLVEQAGFRIEEVKGLPAPFPLALGDGAMGRIALALNKFLIRVARPLFSYQIFMVCSPLPSLEYLLARAEATGNKKAAITGRGS